MTNGPAKDDDKNLHRQEQTRRMPSLPPLQNLRTLHVHRHGERMKTDGVTLMLALMLLAGCTAKADTCEPIGQPVCLGHIASDAEMQDMTVDIEADLQEMMPGERFNVYVEDGCIKTCQYRGAP
jgi:hypothetical protein